MMRRIIIQQEDLYQKALKRKRTPAGWYSRQQVGSHDEQEVRYVLEGTNRKEKPAGDFIYWESGFLFQLPVAKPGHNRDSNLWILSRG